MGYPSGCPWRTLSRTSNPACSARAAIPIGSAIPARSTKRVFTRGGDSALDVVEAALGRFCAGSHGFDRSGPRSGSNACSLTEAVVAVQESLLRKGRPGEPPLEAPDGLSQDGLSREEDPSPRSQSECEPIRHAIQRKHQRTRKRDRQERGAEETVLGRS
jgi:hypothetical protein